MTLRLFGSVDPPAAVERNSKFERKACFAEGQAIEVNLLNMPEKVPDLNPNIFLSVYFTLNLFLIYSYIAEFHKLISRDDQQRAGKYLSLITLCYFGLWNFFSLIAQVFLFLLIKNFWFLLSIISLAILHFSIQQKYLIAVWRSQLSVVDIRRSQIFKSRFYCFGLLSFFIFI